MRHKIALFLVIVGAAILLSILLVGLGILAIMCFTTSTMSGLVLCFVMLGFLMVTAGVVLGES